MLRIDPALVTPDLRLWVAVGSAAFLVIVCAVIFGRRRIGVAAKLGSFVLIVLGGLVSGSLVWSILDGVALREQNTQRQALTAAAAGLRRQALAPGSALSCLDVLAGEAVTAACEKALFASPAIVASATSYVEARFLLLADITAYKKRQGGGLDGILLPLRSALEADPYGVLAHVLAVTESCTSDACKPLGVLHDPSQVRINLMARTFEHYVDRYRQTWSKPEGPLGEGTTGTTPSGAQSNASGPHTAVNVDFPTPASIPPISIMNPEPTGAPVAGAPKASAPATAQARRPSKHSGKPAPVEAVQGSGPGPQSETAQPDPVWLPPPAPPPQ